MDELQEVFSQVTFVLWAIAELGVAAVALTRLRSTSAGLLIGSGFGLMGVKAIAVKLARWMFMGDAGPGDPTRFWVMAASMIVTCMLLVLVAVGILLIPRSLEKLSRPGT